MKKQILYLTTLAALTTGGAVLINNFNANYLTTSVAHAGTAGFNINIDAKNNRWNYFILYDGDNGEPKLDNIGSYANLAKAMNNAPARDENNPQNNTGFNVDSDGTYWYKNDDSYDKQSDVQYQLNDLRYFDLPDGKTVDATNDATISPYLKIIENNVSLDDLNKNTSASDTNTNSTSTTPTNNTSTENQNTTTNPVTANQKQINKDRAALKRVQKELKHSKNKKAKQLLQKQIRHLEKNLKKLSK